MTNPCPTFDCPCDSNPLNGFSSEATDPLAPLATAYVRLDPPFGTQACDRGCVAFASEVIPPPGGGINPPTPEFFSAPQSCTVTCPDGTPFSFEVTAGAFTAPTQAAADAAAAAYACAQANALQLCLGALMPATFTENTAYNGSITASGAGLGQTNTWSLIAGSLPAGLTFNGGTIAGKTATISGTPTVGGTFTFTVQVTNAQGSAATKTYVMNCATGYVVTTNQVFNYCSETVTSTPAFVSGTADAGYDTQLHTLNPGCPIACGPGSSTYTNQLGLSFSSPTLKTWNLKVVWTGVNPFLPTALQINGVNQSGWTQVGNVYTWVGTFQTNNCAATTVSLTDGVDTAGGCISALIEWLTPA